MIDLKSSSSSTSSMLRVVISVVKQPVYSKAITKKGAIALVKSGYYTHTALQQLYTESPNEFGYLAIMQIHKLIQNGKTTPQDIEEIYHRDASYLEKISRSICMSLLEISELDFCEIKQYFDRNPATFYAFSDENVTRLWECTIFTTQDILAMAILFPKALLRTACDLAQESHWHKRAPSTQLILCTILAHAQDSGIKENPHNIGKEFHQILCKGEHGTNQSWSNSASSCNEKEGEKAENPRQRKNITSHNPCCLHILRIFKIEAETDPNSELYCGTSEQAVPRLPECQCVATSV